METTTAAGSTFDLSGGVGWHRPIGIAPNSDPGRNSHRQGITIHQTVENGPVNLVLM